MRTITNSPSWLRRAGVILAAITMLASRLHAGDLVVYNGQIVTVDDRFTIHEAMLIRGW